MKMKSKEKKAYKDFQDSAFRAVPEKWLECCIF